MAAGESTPLLSSSSQAAAAAAQDEEEASSPLLAASAPPPADAPPPPPNNEEVESPLKDKDGNNNPSWMQHKKQHSSTSIETSGDTSESQLSLTQQSKKQRRIGGTTKKKRSGDNNAASSSNTSTTTTTTKRSKKKKKQTTTSDKPKKTIPHFLFDTVRYLAIIASVAMLILQFIPIILLNDKQHNNNNNNITGLQYFVRIYLLLFCTSFILLESRIPLLRKCSFPAHENWILRGFMYTFIGIIGMEQDVAIKVEDIATATGTANILGPDYGTLLASLLIGITTWIMVGVGVLYMVLGGMCLQQWYERLEKEYQNKVGEWKRKKKREKEILKENKEEYVKYEKDRRSGRGEWYDDIETGK
mmetsp:Transcript_2130/g.3662  ORF Transcript_2130/g.3662 Transcript_2130/m.3662 type:complete len:360 (+) Transcript_2130:83-1162(+)